MGSEWTLLRPAADYPEPDSVEFESMGIDVAILHWRGLFAPRRPTPVDGQNHPDLTALLGATRLGLCSEPRCDNVYVDTSPNQSRRYCSDRCSSRANVAAFRARQKAAAAS
mgnify:CR=1 FL=1